MERLAPDARSITAALKLARPGPWSDTGCTDTLLWGKCQGSGSTPYQVSVDLTGPSVRCTCPSRKLPCKHGLGLLLLWVDGDGAVAHAPVPSPFVGDRAEQRASRSTSLATPPDAEPADPVAQARRLDQRLALMTAGATDFETWLADLYRHGLAAARQRPYSYWDDAAARLVDCQLPGLATRVRAIPGRLHGGEDWADQLLTETGRWFTAVRAWQRRDDLSPPDLGNLRAFLGWPVPTDEVRATEPIGDRWVVEGLHRTDDGRLQAQRTWLRADDGGERVVVLDFAAVGAALGVAHVVGSVIEAPVAAYPGSGVRRGLFVEDPEARDSRSRLAAVGPIGPAMLDVASHLAANPFADQFPVGLRVAIVADDSGAAVVDEDGARLPLAADVDPWPIVALTGEAIVPVFAELEDGRVRPLTVEIADRLVPV